MSDTIFTASDVSHGTELWRLRPDGTVELLADLRPGEASSSPHDFRAFAGTLHFFAKDSSGVNQLWRLNSDHSTSKLTSVVAGSATGAFVGSFDSTLYFRDGSNQLRSVTANASTASLVDGGSAAPITMFGGELTVVGANAYFAGSTTANGSEIWKIAPGGAVSRITDIQSGASNSSPSGLVAFGGTLYFYATDVAHGTSFWRLDANGTPEFLKDVSNSTGVFGFGKPTEVNGELYFSSADSSPTTIWKVKANGAIVQASAASGNISDGVQLGNNYYFSAFSSTAGTEIWRIDATGSIQQLADTNPGTASFVSSGITSGSIFQGDLYFSGTTATNGTELWKLTSQGNLTRLTDAQVGTSSSFPQLLGQFQSKLYYTVDTASGRQLWTVNSDGSQTQILGSDGGNGPDITKIFEHEGKIFLSAFRRDIGTELWTLDTTGKIIQYQDIEPAFGTFDSLGTIRILNGSSFVTEGFGQSLVVLQDDVATPVALNGGTDPIISVANGLSPTLFNGEHYFLASTAATGHELWKINTAGQAQLVAEIAAGPTTGANAISGATGGRLFIQASGNTFWTVDPAGGLSQVIETVGGRVPLSFSGQQVLNGDIYFSAFTADVGRELWRLKSSGVVELVSDIATGSASSSLQFLGEYGGALYFTATTAATGSELWKVGSDGVASLVMDINPGTSSSNISTFRTFGDVAYFSATTAATGSELWKIGSDGIPVLVQDLSVGTTGSGAFLLNQQISGGPLYLRASTAAAGDEIWKLESNGTITLAADLVPGTSGSFASPVYVDGTDVYLFRGGTKAVGPDVFKLSQNGLVTAVADLTVNPAQAAQESVSVFDFRKIAGEIYFRAGVSASSPISYSSETFWKVGPAGAASKVSDPTYGNLGSIGSFVEFAGATYFSAQTASLGRELWKIDSTGVLSLVADLNPGTSGGSPGGFTLFNGELYFTHQLGISQQLSKIKVDGSIEPVLDSATAGWTSLSIMGVVDDRIYLQIQTDSSSSTIRSLDAAGNLTAINGSPGKGSAPTNFTTFDLAANPIITSDGGGSAATRPVSENATAVTVVTATDSDTASSALVFSLVGGADQTRFQIDSSTGELSFIAPPDFENPLDAGTDNVYQVKVQVSDGAFVDTQTLAVTVTDVVGEVVTGTIGSEEIRGGLGADSLSGGGGSDTLSGGAGADTLDGGGGDDTFVVIAGDVVSGDTIDGGADRDTLRVDGGGAVSLSGVTITNVEAINLTDPAGTTLTATPEQAALIASAAGANDVVSLGNTPISTSLVQHLIIDADVEVVQWTVPGYAMAIAVPDGAGFRISYTDAAGAQPFQFINAWYDASGAITSQSQLFDDAGNNGVLLQHSFEASTGHLTGVVLTDTFQNRTFSTITQDFVNGVVSHVTTLNDNNTLATNDDVRVDQYFDASGVITLELTTDISPAGTGKPWSAQAREYSVGETQLFRTYWDNSFNQHVAGVAGSQVIEGGAGDDALVGGAGGDVFTFSAPGFHWDTIYDFEDGSDRLDLRAFVIDTRAGLDAAATLTQVGSDTLINFNSGDKITIGGLALGNLTNDDFVR